MLVSHNKRFAFVHIPKTGGTSLSAVLKPYSDEHPLPLRVVGNFFDNRGFERGPLLQTVFGVPRHAPYLDIRTRIGARIDGYYSFAVVRNPWDLVVSEYLYIKRRPRHYLHKAVSAMTSVEDFVDLKLSPSSHPRNRLIQHDFLADSNGDIGVDFVGRFERINEDSRAILSRLGIEADLPHENKTQRKHYRDYHSARSIDMVAKHFERDIAVFGYDY